MKDDIQQERILAVLRLRNGEKPESICTSLGRSKSWLYKWADRYDADDNSWSERNSRQPLTVTSRTPKEVEEIVKMVRLSLYNKDQFCGAQAILWELEDLSVKPLPSLRTINRILSRNELTNRRTGKYESKGTPYPKLPAVWPNQTHQADLALIVHKINHHKFQRELLNDFPSFRPNYSGFLAMFINIGSNTA